ncbi:macro domain-containing protein [Brucepastera parasyntrophica]|uniref:macro domain-containing protein n=1 Tax=Brucepastera parasyntrophica TaxID=2880008 RepID=UPI002109113F|nr:macro domain-containing protein [Brucepastera parasyntrophica]ULQ59952.1 macro domain-containing protein [Brucepastera parasyntrophica]
MKIDIIQGDITHEKTDAIVNAANPALAGGGGVDGAIHRAAGYDLYEECRQIVHKTGECKPGFAVLTKGYNLLCRYIIHAVGPVWRGGNNGEEEILLNCYRNILALAIETGIKSIAIPNISTGIYGFPKKKAANIVGTYFKNPAEEQPSVEYIRFVCFDEENYLLYKNEFA